MFAAPSGPLGSVFCAHTISFQSHQPHQRPQHCCATPAEWPVEGLCPEPGQGLRQCTHLQTAIHSSSTVAQVFLSMLGMIDSTGWTSVNPTKTLRQEFVFFGNATCFARPCVEWKETGMMSLTIHLLHRKLYKKKKVQQRVNPPACSARDSGLR